MTSPTASDANTRRIVMSVALALVLLAAGAIAQVIPAGPMEVRELVLVNANGERRALLSLVDDRPVLRLYDDTGRLELTLGLTEDGPALLTKDQLGNVHNLLRTDPEVTPTGPTR